MHKFFYYSNKQATDADALAYKTRVEADGGSVLDFTYIDETVKLLKAQGVWSNLITWTSAFGGIKKDGSNRVSKLYCLKSKDAVQATGSAQPLWVSTVGNNKNHLTYSGAQSLVSNTNIGISGDVERQILVVFKRPASAQRPVVGMGTLGAAGSVTDVYTSTLPGVAYNASGGSGFNNLAASSAYTLGATTFYHLAYKNTTDWRYAVNNGADTFRTNTNPLSLGNGPFYQGTGPANLTTFHSGDIYETMAFDVQLSTSQLSALKTAINTKFVIW